MAESARSATFFFTDIAGSTRLWQQNREAMATAHVEHDNLLTRLVEGHRGRVFKTVGDAFCCVFELPGDAVSCAIDAQSALLPPLWQSALSIKVRMALHSCIATPSESGDDYFGPELALIARLLSAGHGGQILVSNSTANLLKWHFSEDIQLKDLGKYRLRDIEDEQTIYQVIRASLQADFPPLKTDRSKEHNLPPQLTSLVGRDHDLHSVVEALRDHPLVTICGTGGSGKTTLSIAVGYEFADDFEHGVWLVELASISDSNLVVQAISSSLGLSEEGGASLELTLVTVLQSRTTLIILDNCEHLVEECARVVNLLLRSCPGAKILATTRESLFVKGECLIPLAPLGIPTEAISGSVTQAQFERLKEIHSIQLFIERAREALPTFQVSETNIGEIANICRRLDGIPLALELAAARSAA